MVILITRKHQFIYQYGEDNVDKDVTDLTNLLIKLSPFPIDLSTTKINIKIDDDPDAIRENENRLKKQSMRQLRIDSMHD